MGVRGRRRSMFLRLPSIQTPLLFLVTCERFLETKIACQNLQMASHKCLPFFIAVCITLFKQAKNCQCICYPLKIHPQSGGIVILKDVAFKFAFPNHKKVKSPASNTRTLIQNNEVWNSGRCMSMDIMMIFDVL